jgi:hypothetical protein
MGNYTGSFQTAGMQTSVITKGSQPMAKAMSIAGMVVAGLIAFVFGFDLILSVPFSRANPFMDIGFVLCAAALGYLSWSAFRETK